MKNSTKKLINVCLASFAQGVFLGDAVKTVLGKNNIETPVGLICRLGIDIVGLIGCHGVNKINTAEYYSAVLQEMESEDNEEIEEAEQQ